MAGIKSVLRMGLEALPDNVKGQSVPNALKKAGVKEEEIKHSGFEVDPGTSYSKDELLAKESKRTDEFGSKTSGKDFAHQFRSVSLAPGTVSPKYKENVYTYKEGTSSVPTKDEIRDELESMSMLGEAEYGEAVLAMQNKYGIKKATTVERAVEFNMDGPLLKEARVGASRYTSEHFPGVENYLMHTRTYDDYLGGADTRVVQEIQSDLHQGARLDADAGIPESPYTKSWLAKGIEREVMQAADDKLGQVAIPISGEVSELKRADGVQKWYESSVVNTAKKIAKQQGMDFAMKDIDGVKYATLSGAPKGFSLYASPAAAVGAAYTAMKAGSDPRSELANQGYDETEIAAVMKDADFVANAVESGYSEEEALSFIKQSETDIEAVQTQAEDPSVLARVKEYMLDPYKNSPVIQGYKASIAEANLVSPEQMDAAELLTNLKVIQPNMASISTRVSGAIGNSDDFAKARVLEESSAQRILSLAKERGINLVWEAESDPGTISQLAGAGQFYLDTEAGPVPLDTKIWSDIEAEQYEIYGAAYGGVAGAKLGLEAASKVSKHPYALAAGAAAGSLFGASGGSAVGTELDYLKGSIQLLEGMSTEIAGRKATTAAEASIVGDLVGIGLVKGGPSMWKGIVGAKDYLLGGNKVAAKNSLLDNMFLSETEAVDILTNLDKAVNDELLVTKSKTQINEAGIKTVVNTTAKPGPKDLIRALTLTEPGGEDLVAAASKLNPKAGKAVAKSIDMRAKDLLASTAELTDESVGRILVEDLSNYTADVKKRYGDVKGQVAASPRINSFAFDYAKLAIDPVIDQLQKNITDPTVLERYILQSKRIKGMSDSRTLTDLIEVRQLVNDFKFNKRIPKNNDVKALNNVITNIDGAIRVGAHEVMENPDKWLKDFATAKKDYAQMKGLEKNVMAKALNRPGVSEEVVTKAFTKYITTIDGSFQDIMSKLPKQSRLLTEGSVINSLADKYTAGKTGGPRAVNFPMLAADLDKVSFTMAGPRKMKAAIKEMAEVFKNDVPLAQTNSNMQLPKFQQGLSADLGAKAKYALASNTWTRIMQALPTKEGANASLVKTTAKLLENPLNAKLVKEFMDGVENDVVLSQQVVEMQQAAVRQAASATDATAPRVDLYGDGKILSFKGSGTAQKVPVHRIATHGDRKTVADTYGIDINDNTKLDKYLANEGYMAVQLGTGKVRRIN